MKSGKKPAKRARAAKGSATQGSEGKLQNRNRKLQAKLDEAQETIRAITNGEVDAFVVETGSGQQVFTLRSAEHPYRVMVESMNEGAATLLLDGTFIYSNRQLADLLRKGSMELPGKTLRDFVASRDRAVFEAAFEQAKTKASKADVFLSLDDGSLIAAQISMAAVDLEGTSAISAVITDLTEQKQNEALIVSEKLTRSILEQAAEAIIVTDENGWIIRANPAAHQLALLNVFSKSFDESFPLVKSTGEVFSFNELKQAGQRTRGLAVSFRRSDGNFFLLSMSVSHLRNSDVGLGFVFTLTDITPLKNTEAALRFQSHVTETIAKNAASCLIMLDRNGSPTYMNPAAEKVTGFQLEEIKDKHIHSVLHYKKPDGTRYDVSASPLWSSERSQAAGSEHEETFIRKDGTFFPVSYSLAPLTSDGEDIGSVLEFRDITEQKRAESELKAAKDAAESASNLKTAFLANMSHEIRTPLGAILGFTEILKEADISAQDREEYLEIISRSGKSLMRLIDDILDLSKVEAGKLDVELLKFSLSDLLHEVMAMFSERAMKKGVSLSLSVAPGTPEHVKSDPTRLRQILVNIVGNAVKFTQQGSVTVKVSAQASPETTGSAGTMLSIQVSDTGPGLTSEQSARLFEPFSQGDNSTTRVYGGTGLGLVLSRRLAVALGGSVTLESSDIGKGSTFCVKIYVELTDADEINRLASFDRQMSETTRQEPSKKLPGLRILVVDDSPENQLLLERILSKQGAVVELAGNGREGVERALARDFDVVLMDIQMPVLDGYGATKELRKSGFNRPIIALTAYAMEEERQRCLSIGCNAHLSKPINTSILMETVQNMVKP